MGIETTWTCDRCEKSQKDDSQMWDVALAYRHTGSSVPSFSYAQKSLWCRGCLESVGVFKVKDPEKPSSTPVMTLEEMIRELVREELEKEDLKDE